MWPAVASQRFSPPYNTNPLDPNIGFWPTMGYTIYHNDTTNCYSMYLNPNSYPFQPLALTQGIAYPTRGGTVQPFSDVGPWDVIVIDNPSAVSKKGGSGTTIGVMSLALANTLFAPDQLGISMDQFVAAGGPMGPVVLDANGGKDFTGWGASDICDASDDSFGAQPRPQAGRDPQGRLLTSVSITNGATTTLDSGTTLTAQVNAGDQAVTSGIVYFTVDGTLVGSADVDVHGVASLKVDHLALGQHAPSSPLADSPAT